MDSKRGKWRENVDKLCRKAKIASCRAALKRALFSALGVGHEVELKNRKQLYKNSSEDEIANVNFYTSTSYT